MPKHKIDVVLTKQACEEYSQEAVMKFFLRNGKYFLCTRYEQNGYFIDLTVVAIDDNSELEYPSNYYDLSIPINNVSYVVSALPEKMLGFSNNHSI